MTARHFSPARLTLLAALAAAALTSACVPLVLGGAVAGGAVMANDRRTSGSQLDDEGIELRASNRLRDTLPGAHFNVTSINQQVLLTGEVPTDAAKAEAERVVSQVANVRSVVNELGVMPNSSLAQRSADALTTSRIKTALVQTPDVSANNIKVVTERGVAYLMGLVTASEAELATETVRRVGSVQRVVRMFEVKTAVELMGRTPPAPVISGQPAVTTPAATAAPAATPVPVLSPPAPVEVATPVPVKN